MTTGNTATMTAPATDPVLIVGASLGGLRTAEALRRHSYSGPITVIGEEIHVPYNRPPLSKEALLADTGPTDLTLSRRANLDNITWRLGRRVSSADLDRRVITTSDGTAYRFRGLVIATGLRPRRLPSNDPTLSGRHVLRTFDDAQRLRHDLRPDARVLIVGAGLIGCEVAAVARALGCDVTVIGSTERPMQHIVGALLGAELQRRHESNGIHFLMSARVDGVLGDDRVEGVELCNGLHIAGDVLVEAIGSVPNTEWLDNNDLDTDGGVLTDAAMRVLGCSGTVHPEVCAVGDITRFPGTHGSAPTAVQHWNNAIDTARRAGLVAATRFAAPDHYRRIVETSFDPVSTFWSEQGNLRLTVCGTTEKADSIAILDGELLGDCTVGYYLHDELIGVCSLGTPAAMRYRQLVQHPDAVSAGGTVE